MTGQAILVLRSNTSKVGSTLDTGIQKLDDIHFIKFWKRIYDQRLDIY